MAASEQAAANREEKRRLVEHNTAVLGAIFRECGIGSVDVEFDGYSDSGAVEDITFLGTDGHVLTAGDDLLSRTVEGMQKIVSSRGVLSRTEDCLKTLEDAIEDCVMDALAVDFPGWEVGTGACGSVSIEPEAISVKIDLRSVEYEEREFTAQAASLDEDRLPGPSPGA